MHVGAEQSQSIYTTTVLWWRYKLLIQIDIQSQCKQVSESHNGQLLKKRFPGILNQVNQTNKSIISHLYVPKLLSWGDYLIIFLSNSKRNLCNKMNIFFTALIYKTYGPCEIKKRTKFSSQRGKNKNFTQTAKYI